MRNVIGLWQQYMGDRPYEKTCPDLPSGAGGVEE
jgi:hypothetical protein